VKTHMKHALLICVAAWSALAQSMGNPVVDGLMKGVEARQRQEALELQKKQLEIERQRLRIAELEAERNRTNAARPTEAGSGASNSEVEAQVEVIFRDLRPLYPDFDQYVPKFAKIMTLFPPQKQALTAEEYVEAVYVIAKYATLLNKVEPAQPIVPTPKPQD
jgi:hypothetical protein